VNRILATSLVSILVGCSGSTDTSSPPQPELDSATETSLDAALDAALPEAAPDVPADAPSDAAIDTQPADTGDCLAELTQEIAPVIKDLLYLSESDYPFESVSFADSGSGEITADHFLSLVGADAGTLVEKRTFDDFFDAYLLNSDPRYGQMRTILETRLTDTTVIRLGEIQVQVYLVGRTKCGQIAGLKTVSIET